MKTTKDVTRGWRMSEGGRDKGGAREVKKKRRMTGRSQLSLF